MSILQDTLKAALVELHGAMWRAPPARLFTVLTGMKALWVLVQSLDYRHLLSALMSLLNWDICLIGMILKG